MSSQVSKKHKRIFFASLTAALAALALWSGPAPLRAPAGAQSVNGLERVTLGGVKQWISIRGHDRRNPVLLFLHGGPGSANLAKLRVQCPELEQHFVVVTWDQRGAGKSQAAFDADTLSIEQIVSDTHELILMLKARFGVDAVYLMGFSWGTVPGLLVAARYPKDLHAYIGAGQIVDYAEGERQSLAYVQDVARERNDEETLRALSAIDPAYNTANWYKQLMTQRKWLLKYGGVYHTADSYNHEALMLLRAPEYSLMDFALWPGASARSLKTFWPALMQINLAEMVPEMQVPVYFFAGRYDRNAPSPLVEAYFAQLRAPAGKELIWFEDAAHDVFFDQPARMVETLLRIKHWLKP
ncbi:MAG TPA: alpha/beta hydrolase [Anaerolineae bacterium]|nr:alpha/beta hydrolase [Anaerolineae bacterium]